MIPFLDDEHAGSTSPRRPPRRARVQVFVDDALHEVLVDLGSAAVAGDETLHGRHSFIDTAFMAKVGEVCLADERVRREIKALELPEGATVEVEPWAYATDGVKDMKERWTMVSTTQCYRRE